MQAQDKIEAVLVQVKEDEAGEKNIIAYVISKEELNSTELRNELSKQLPDYMIPAHYVQLDEFPLTSNGKVDKKALPNPEGLGISTGVEYVVPRNVLEEKLVGIWEEVLNRDRIGIHDSFFALGGDSIKSIQLVSRLKQQGYTIKIEHVLRNPTIGELSGLVLESKREVDQSSVEGEVELTPIQQYFFKDSGIVSPHHFNQSVLLKSKDVIDPVVLEKCISYLVGHHDALRIKYKRARENWEQVNQGITGKHYRIDSFDLRDNLNGLEDMARLGEELQSSFDLETGPLFKVGHFRLEDGDRLALIIHHLVVDGVSWRILLEDLSILYTQYKTGETPRLALKTDSFQRWSYLQKEYSQGKKQESERSYWESICSEDISVLPQNKEVSEEVSQIDDSVSFSLDSFNTELLQTKVHGIYNTQVNDVLLTSLGLAIKEVLGIEKSVIKMEGHGREEIIDEVDISRTVGWFTSVYPFVLDVSGVNDNRGNLVQVKEHLRRVPNKGVGYGILRYLSKEPGLSYKPSIVFNYLGDFGNKVGGSEESIFRYSSENIGRSTAEDNSEDTLLNVSGMLVSDQLSISIGYSSLNYNEETIKKLVESYEHHLVKLITELGEAEQSYLTPSDLTFKGLTIEELTKINQANTVEDIYKLSPLQEGIYYHWLSSESTILYFEQMSYRLKSSGLVIEEVKKAYELLISRYAILRTSFTTNYSDSPLQIVWRSVSDNFTYENLEGKEDQEDYILLTKQKDKEGGFDLSESSQMRLKVLDLGAGEYEFIWSHHHILIDGWCMSILINDFYQLLNSLHQKIELSLPRPIPYSKYIEWLNTVDKKSSEGYWKEYLLDYSNKAEIPFQRKIQGEQSYAPSSLNLGLEGERYRNLNNKCVQLGITQNTFIQGVWGYLLSRYNNTDDVVFGSVVSGRPGELKGVEDMVGLFINTIPVRVKYGKEDTSDDLLKSLQEDSVTSSPHHYLNLSEVQSQSQLWNELIDHIIVFENYAVQDAVTNIDPQQGQELTIKSVDVFEQTNYDLSIVVVPSNSSLAVSFNYNSNKYDVELMDKLVQHFNHLIEQFSINSKESLAKFSFLSKEEEDQLLHTFNDTKVAYPKDKTLIDLFEEQVANTPDNIAVIFEGVELTYKELNEQSNQLGDYLRKNYEIHPDDLVGIKLDRSEQMIIAILGVLKSGGAYVPIDPEYPEDRIYYMIEDSGCKVLIDDQELSKFKQKQENYNKENLPKVTTPHDLAYVIYTSGSTGQPKGVMIEHQSIVNSNISRHQIYKKMKSFLLLSSFSFDSSIAGTFSSLTCGAILHIILKEKVQNPIDVSKYIKRNEISHLLAVPSYYNLLLSELSK
jgi:non-ribosomal peptide synthase protein (TIGR01720 family)